MTVALIACSKSKRRQACRAEQLYTGYLFRRSLAYARRAGAERIYILSAKHELVTLDQILRPYDLTLSELSASQRQDWGSHVARQLEERGADLRRDHFLLLAGRLYREPLLLYLRSYEAPMHHRCFLGLGFGQQLQFLVGR